MSRKQTLRVILIAFASVASLACASSKPTGNSVGSVQRAGAVLVVRNSNTRDVNLYVMNGSNRVRIGTARAMATSRLSLPAIYLAGSGGVVLQADAIGSNVSYTFPAMFVAADNRVELQLGNVLAMSSFGIW
jgi:hypothetical protein